MKNIKTFEQFLNEGKDSFIEVSVRDAKKALEFLNDEYRNKFKTSGSNKYTFKKEDDAYNAMEDLGDLGIEVTDSSLDESVVNENKNPEGDAKVLSFMKRLAKEWDLPVARVADFIKQSIKRNGY